MTFINITLDRGFQLQNTRPTRKSVVHSFSTKSFQIWNAMSNVIDFYNSPVSFKYKTKAFY